MNASAEGNQRQSQPAPPLHNDLRNDPAFRVKLMLIKVMAEPTVLLIALLLNAELKTKKTAVLSFSFVCLVSSSIRPEVQKRF